MSHSQPQQAQQPKQWQIIATVSFYIVSALAMVVANKWVLKNIPIPLTFLLLQLLISVFLLALCRTTFVTGLVPALRFKGPAQLEWPKVKALVPMILLNFLGLTFNTFTLKDVDASFYQVARGLVLPFTVVVSLIFLKNRPSLHALLACLVITVGFLIGVYPSLSEKYRHSGELGFTMTGVLFGLAGSITSAFHVVVIKTSLGAVGNSAIDLSWYSNCLTSICLVPLIIFLGEVGGTLEFFKSATVDQMNAFVMGTVITGVFGFLMSVAGILSVKITSPITHMVSSAVRSVAQAVAGMWLFGEIMTVSRASSVGTILGGSIWYTWVKHQEQVAAYQKQILTENKPQSSLVNGESARYAPLDAEDPERGERRA